MLFSIYILKIIKKNHLLPTVICKRSRYHGAIGFTNLSVHSHSQEVTYIHQLREAGETPEKQQAGGGRGDHEEMGGIQQPFTGGGQDFSRKKKKKHILLLLVRNRLP